LVAQATRRGALASLLGGTLGVLSVVETAGKKGKGKKGKGKGKKSKTCKPACDKCKIQTCVKGKCGCAPGSTEAGGVCGMPVQCKSAIEICTSNNDCCSFRCDLPDGSGALRCNFSTTFCNIDFDCRDGGPCRGFLCTEEYRTRTGCS
jgi:hypothetical protein